MPELLGTTPSKRDRFIFIPTQSKTLDTGDDVFREKAA